MGASHCFLLREIALLDVRKTLEFEPVLARVARVSWGVVFARLYFILGAAGNLPRWAIHLQLIASNTDGIETNVPKYHGMCRVHSQYTNIKTTTC